ncbi:MAG: HNH endonuclease [Deltaproteobacteria bacterium]|jgi:hypothetical protein|nr:HNH endonuclease [Deltaproteobacteria bacterium]
MNLKSFSNIELLNGVRSLRGDERKLDRQIVEYICEIESRRLYAELGFANIIDWLVKDLGYSESSAYRRMMAARAIRGVPEAAGKIEDGRLNLVTLAKVQSAIRREEKRTGHRVSLETRSTMIAQTENKTLRETVRIAAEHFPEAIQASGSQIFSTQIVLTDEQLALLERVRELRSHSNFGASLGEIVAAIANEYLDRNDPLRREVKPRSVVKEPRDTPIGKTSAGGAAHSMEEPLSEISGGSPQGGTTVVFESDLRSRSGARRTSIAPSTRNFVRRRAGDACEYQGTGGQRCGSRFQTQMDHVIPVALGGKNDLTNLRLLCRTHNLLMAEKTLGLKKMSQFRIPL